MLASRLNFDARIVNNPQFEEAFLKQQKNQAYSLSENKKFEVQSLLLEPQSKSTKSVRHDSYAERALKRIRC